ncbi:uncharacterized protein TRIADDRAFT_62061 [Trichoplax adhaerens]|uniref:SH2 domain-containing protein n=1 Tax=Trichoplax adhaerens TaxID=10228 RepID=B3SCQ6_TRIAD|nr:predicted protein [Trichoplax adhaerens]EDV19495.1 predicted protein [Trichoplax adhaerens]|eukprot:XP_002118012.1 predicted protein [Trichoplax adhaerens]
MCTLLQKLRYLMKIYKYFVLREKIFEYSESIRRVKEAKSKWMKHNMDLSDAETMLQYEAAGTFFVINTQNSTEHVLLVKLKDEGSVVAKFRILSQGNDVRIDDFNQSFKTIDELIGCYVCYQDKELKVQLKVLDDEHYTRIDDLSRRPSFDGPDTSSESIGQTEPPISPPLSPLLSPSNSISDFPCERQDLIYDIRGISDIEGNKSSIRRGSLRRAMPFFPSKRTLTLSRDAQERNESTLKLLFEIDPKKCKLGPWDPYLHEVYIRLKKLKENSLKDEENQHLVDRTKLNAFESELESKIYSESREFIYKYLKKKYSRSLKTVTSHMEEIAKQNLKVLRLPYNLELPYDKIRSEFKKMEKENLPERKLHYLIKAFGKLPKEQRDLKTMVYCISKISLQTLVYEADYIDNLVDPKMLHNESFQKAFVTFRNTILFLQQLNSSGEDYLSNLLKDKQKIVRLIILADENDCPVAQSIAIEPQKTIRDLYKICKSCTESILKLPCKEDEYILSIVDSNDELNSLDDNEDKVQLAIHGSGDYAEAISSDFINFIYHRNNAIQNFVYE